MPIGARDSTICAKLRNFFCSEHAVSRLSAHANRRDAVSKHTFVANIARVISDSAFVTREVTCSDDGERQQASE